MVKVGADSQTKACTLFNKLREEGKVNVIHYNVAPQSPSSLALSFFLHTIRGCSSLSLIISPARRGSTGDAQHVQECETLILDPKSES
jgi:hypothetical protein